MVTAYLEITPFDSMKYEVDKKTGYLRIDRPQRGSSLPPCSYGFIPRTYADHRVALLSKGAKKGNRDPLDICLISEQPISRAEIMVSARVLGGFCMIDDGLWNRGRYPAPTGLDRYCRWRSRQSVR